jgi:hypothetical protein
MSSWCGGEKKRCIIAKCGVCPERGAGRVLWKPKMRQFSFLGGFHEQLLQKANVS